MQPRENALQDKMVHKTGMLIIYVVAEQLKKYSALYDSYDACKRLRLIFPLIPLWSMTYKGVLYNLTSLKRIFQQVEVKQTLVTIKQILSDLSVIPVLLICGTSEPSTTNYGTANISGLLSLIWEKNPLETLKSLFLHQDCNISLPLDLSSQTN